MQTLHSSGIRRLINSKQRCRRGIPLPGRSLSIVARSWRDYFADERSAAEQFFGEEYELEDTVASPSGADRDRFTAVRFGKDGTLVRRQGSSWRAKEKGQAEGLERDFLSDLGAKQLYNINVDHGQSVDHIDSLFTGEVLGHKSDIADGSLRAVDFRVFNNIVGDYYVAPEFLMKVAMHMAKNYLYDLGAMSANTRVPLILGIWGEKGMGKTFQTELALKKLGAETVVMSSGELEHEWAGTPGKLIRERYRKASEMSKVRGKMTALLIHDIDAGLGHFDHVQVTVNNQIVIGTLMNICDNPNVVSTGQDWFAVSRIRRTPIIVTGNDFSKMFAPLIRDGRMDKYYWKPTRDDMINIVWQMYKEDGIAKRDVEALLDRFRHQPLDFYGALRASTYDDQIRDWIKADITGEEFAADEANLRRMSQVLLSMDRDELPKFEPVQLTLDMLVAEGERLEREQQQVNDHKLSEQYLKHVGREAARKQKEATERRVKREAEELRQKYERELILAGGGMGGGADAARKPARSVRQKGYGA
ncbi:hypothetical protein HYH02_005378 [Chlamydomonas schloesseri]|uniref:Ribulose bisphosphate carboxylase/oxygenase activase, chloroplastic n=1 Tax=Chlamydomonas schloesseri TaxID=2026947 RepID=A0A836B7K0_9CHLO|nr:hypothetical protein HYH02_005378 [Chlamydomonas schloesseri]|eukprot:KAG2449855.1 hypothetical protein HYH02_005378 [Chlamydomonas schloesseri]